MTNIFNDFDPYIWKKDLQYIYEVEKIISEACGHKKVGTYVGKYVILCLVEYFDFDIQIQKYHQKYLIHKKDFERCSILKKKYSTCVEYTPRIGSERTEFYNNFWHCDRKLNTISNYNNHNNRAFLFACMLDQIKTTKDNLSNKVNYFIKKRNNIIYMLIHFKHFLINNLQSNKSIKETYIIPTYEAYEKRDVSNKKYLGKSVFSAIKLVNSKISKKLKNTNLHDQELIDSLLIKLDGTKQKSNLGANAILAVSIAVKKLSAKIKKIPLYKTFLLKNNFKLPYPLMNIINGGVHANNGLRIQEFMIRPDKAKSFSEAMRMCFLIIQNLKTLIKRNKLSTSVGDEGGFAPMINSNEKALDLIVKAINKSGFKNGKDVSICLDVAANELFKNANYSIHSKKFISVDKTIKKYLKIINKYHIKSIEDPFAENDWTSWNKIMKSINNVQIVGDDLYVTNLERLKKGFLNNSSNAILIKLNQIGTVSETLDVIRFAQIIGYKTIISHRSGDSEDTFISDLAVGTNSNQIKTGSLARSERVAKYNQLIRIEEDLGKKAKMNKIH